MAAAPAAAPAQRVAVVGAGVAGLQATAALRHAGLDVTVLEKSSNLQVQRWHYTIPGFEWPQDAGEPYPSGPEVQAYIESYAQHAGLLPSIRFNAEVQGVEPLGNRGAEGWRVTYRQDGQAHSEAFSFLVVATGLFNLPARPSWARPEAVAASGFTGGVVDARDFTSVAAAEGKRVLIIGGGKTAIDVAVAVSRVAASATLVARKGHVMAPQTVLGLIPFEMAVYTRWSWALQPAWYDASRLVKALHAIFGPVKAAVWALLGWLFPLHTGVPGELAPPHSTLEGAYDTIGIVPAHEVKAAFSSGGLRGVRGEVEALGVRGARLASGEEVKADLVILATGYRATEHELLPEELRQAAGYEGGEGGSQWLYRNVLPVGGALNLAFIGLNATFQHVLTTALQARWLADVLLGKIKLPSAEAQAADVAACKEWLSSPAFGFRRSNNFVWAQHGKYHDQLVRDLGAPVHRKGNVLAEVFGFQTNQDFAELFPRNATAARARAGAATPAAKRVQGVAVRRTQVAAPQARLLA